MVVLSASICTRGGKALVSRQYVEMTRMRIEGLLAAFPKLVGHAKQHTFVETDTVRYVYQPLENQMYLLLITTKASNIVEDLSTLRLLSKVVPDVAGALHEQAINEAAFELIFAFDEVLTAGGYREDATLSSIRTNLQMESHEEVMYNMVKESKEEAARATMQEKQKEIGNRQKQAIMQAFTSQNGMPGQQGTPQSGMVGFGGGGQPTTPGMFPGFGSDNATNYDQNQPYDANPYQFSTNKTEPEPAEPRVPVKGMKLGTGGQAAKKDSFMAAMAAEDNLSLLSSTKQTPIAKPTIPAAPVTLAIEEKITVEMNREGGIENSDVKGTLSITANTDQGSAIQVQVNKDALTQLSKNNWNFATHPKVNKITYENNGILTLKDSTKGFPLNRPVAVLRWTHTSPQAAPLTVNCWPEDQGDGTILVNIEYEFTSNQTLENVDILLPLGTSDPPVIEAIDGNYKHDPQSGVLCWHHEVIDNNNATGSLEFAIAGTDTDVFFPIRVGFRSESLLCPIEVLNVSDIGSGAPVPNALVKSFVPDTYQCS